MQSDSPTEYRVTATEAGSGRPMPPFLVPTATPEAARRMSQRRYLVIETVEPYEPREGERKPKLYPLGPPISDKVFENDYHNRPPDPDGKAKDGDLTGAERTLIGVVVGFFTGFFGP